MGVIEKKAFLLFDERWEARLRVQTFAGMASWPLMVYAKSRNPETPELADEQIFYRAAKA